MGTLLANFPGMTGNRHGTSKSRAAALLLALLPVPGSLPAADMAGFQAAADIRAAAEAVVLERLADAPGQVTARAEELDPRLQMPACDAPLSASLPARTQLSSRLTAEVRCNGARQWRLFVPVKITVRQSVVVAALPLERGKVLAPGDVLLAERELGAISGGYLTSVEAVAGQVLRRAVPAGAALAPALLEAPVLVRRGQAVTLQARSGVLTVQAPAVARGDGALGQVIEVQNISSKKIMQAIVRNEKTVEVYLP